MTTRVCDTCSRTLPIDFYSKCGRGNRRQCKACMDVSTRAALNRKSIDPINLSDRLSKLTTIDDTVKNSNNTLSNVITMLEKRHHEDIAYRNQQDEIRKQQDAYLANRESELSTQIITLKQHYQDIMNFLSPINSSLDNLSSKIDSLIVSQLNNSNVSNLLSDIKSDINDLKNNPIIQSSASNSIPAPAPAPAPASSFDTNIITESPQNSAPSSGTITPERLPEDLSKLPDADLLSRINTAGPTASRYKKNNDSRYPESKAKLDKLRAEKRRRGL
jgi:hypothetical protein